MLKRYLTFLSFILILTGCANYKIHIDKSAEDWSNSPLPNEGLIHRVYLIGDAGGAEYKKPLPAIEILRERLKAEKKEKNVSVIYLGDNIYPNGLPPAENDLTREERKLDEFKLKAQLDPVKDFEGNVFFVAGNHDWYGYGLKGVKAQKDFIEDYLGRKDILMPEPGCGDPYEIKLEDDLILVLLDSQWWLENWNKEPEMNEDCDVKSREGFKLAIRETLKSNRNKNVIVALHHPLVTYGPHGGGFTFKDHLFPLTKVNDKLWIPLPVVGSIYPLFRTAIGTKQDIANPAYKALKSAILSPANQYGSFLFVSGHEHTLQYITQDKQSFIVSGSGTKKAPTYLGEGAQFTYGASGFAHLDIFEDGSIWVQFWAEKDGKGKVVFRKKIREALPKFIEKPDTITYEEGFEPKTVPLSQQDFIKTGLGKKIWGEHYREAYNELITVPQLNLETYKGGVKPIKRGGGNQTRSLRLENKEERQYTMRSVDKDPSQTLGYPFNKTFIKDLVNDNFSAAHPLAALVIPKMAAAAGVYHTNPKVYFVPKQKALESHNEDYGNQLYLLEERPNDKVWKDATFFGKPDDIVSTAKALNKVLDDHDHRIDKQMVVRSRLFDNLIGDWDRHDDQWRWAVFKKDGKHIYHPIPRDRDQAFSRYDGLFISAFRPLSPAFQPLRSYDEKLAAIHWSNYGARHFDPTFLSEASWEDWEAEAKHIQENLTPEIIDQAFAENWPDNFTNLDGEFIKTRLKARLKNLQKIARDMYDFLAERVDIVGTNEKDFIQVTRAEDNSTTVEIFHLNKKGEKKSSIYKRTFKAKDTKEIRIYGLEKDDIFEVTGRANAGPKLRLLGGTGEDTYKDDSIVGGGKKTLVYDFKSEENILEVGAETKKKLTDNPLINAYNRKEPHHEFNYGFGFPALGINPDDGVALGGLVSFTNYKFKKAPFANRHTFNGLYAAGTGGFRLSYAADFIDVFSQWDFRMEAAVRTPLYTSNFYGLGNGTTNEEEELGMDFYRVRQREFLIFPALMRRQYNSSFMIGPQFESIRVDNTEGRIIETIAESLDPNIFEGMEFLGMRAVIDYSNVDQAAFPTRGIALSVNGGWKFMMDDASRNFPYVEAAISLYQSLDRNGRFVIATRLGGKQIFNNEFEFFQAAILGGAGPNANMRGFRRDRFSGRSSFYQNIDLRMQLLSSRNRAIPFVAGLFAGFDYGRVWLDGEEETDWHNSIGGGIFISPFDQATIRVGIFKGDDEPERLLLGGGFFF